MFSQGCEVMVPGILGFIIFKVDNRLEAVSYTHLRVFSGFAKNSCFGVSLPFCPAAPGRKAMVRRGGNLSEKVVKK